MRLATPNLPGGYFVAPRRTSSLTDYDRSDVNRLLKVLRHQEADRVPHLEFRITNQSIYEYVLERKLDYSIGDGYREGQAILPEDYVEFAQRLGMDAVTCEFSWRPNNVFARSSDGKDHYVGGSVRNWADLETLDPPPPLSQQLNRLERMVRAAQGTGVGVIASFSSFFESALLAVGLTEAMLLFYDNRPFLEKLMDILWDHQQRVVQAVCDRFGDELALTLISDNIAHTTGLLIDPTTFHKIFTHRMQSLIAPAKECGKLVAFHTGGKIDQVISLLADTGFDILHPIAPECNDIVALRKRWAGKLAFVGNISSLVLAYGRRDDIAARVKQHCIDLAPGGGFVLGSSPGIIDGIPPENYLAMVQAVHQYGHYDRLGQPGDSVLLRSPQLAPAKASAT
jgi:uroporphyrinogen-III decarboxylase